MTTPESTVQVEQHHNAGDEPGAIESSELFVFVDSTLDEDDLTAEQARAWLVAREAIATAVREAVEFIEEQQ